MHQIVFAILDHLEHESSQASISPLNSPPNVIPDLTLKLGNFGPLVGDMEE